MYNMWCLYFAGQLTLHNIPLYKFILSHKTFRIMQPFRYPPTLAYVVAGFYIFTHSWRLALVLVKLMFIFAILSIFFLFTKLDKKKIGIGLVLASPLLPILAFCSWIDTLVIALGLLNLLLAQRKDSLDIFLAGLVAGIGLSIKQSMIVFILVTLGLLVTYRKLRYVAIYILGVVLSFFTLVAPVLVVNGFDCLYYILLYNTLHAANYVTYNVSFLGKLFAIGFLILYIASLVNAWKTSKVDIVLEVLCFFALLYFSYAALLSLSQPLSSLFPYVDVLVLLWALLGSNAPRRIIHVLEIGLAIPTVARLLLIQAWCPNRHIYVCGLGYFVPIIGRYWPCLPPPLCLDASLVATIAGLSLIWGVFATWKIWRSYVLR